MQQLDVFLRKMRHFSRYFSDEMHGGFPLLNKQPVEKKHFWGQLDYSLQNWKQKLEPSVWFRSAWYHAVRRGFIKRIHARKAVLSDVILKTV